MSVPPDRRPSLPTGIEPWRAGGYALWLVSNELARWVSPIAQTVASYHPGTHPVLDGHVTLVGNIGKGIAPQLEELLIAQLSAQAAHINRYLENTSTVLAFTTLFGDAAKPSQTLCMEAQATAEWSNLYVNTLAGLQLPENPNVRVHTSILYNAAPQFPLDQNAVNDLLNVCSHIVPYTARMDRVEVYRTHGMPHEWTRVA